MNAWVATFLILAGGLFALKILYVVCTAGVLPFTQGALYVSTSQIRIRAFLDAVPMTPDHILYDLGCGDGRVLRAARRRYGVRGVGFEINPLAYVHALIRCLARPGLTVRWRDFRSADLAGADVVFCYLFPDMLKTIRPKLEKELRPGTRLVSCNFPLPQHSPSEVIRPEPARHSDPIYIYTWPLG